MHCKSTLSQGNIDSREGRLELKRPDSSKFFNQYSNLMENSVVQDRIKDIQSTVLIARKLKIANMAPKREVQGVETLL